MADHSLEPLFPSGKMKIWRERTGWPRPINTVLMQARMAGCDRTVLQGCVFLGCGPGYVNKDHSGCHFSSSILDTRERRGKDKGKLWEIYICMRYIYMYIYLRTLLLPQDMSSFEPMCGCSLRLPKQVRKMGKYCSSSTDFPMETDTPKCYNTSVWSFTSRKSLI